MKYRRNVGRPSVDISTDTQPMDRSTYRPICRQTYRRTYRPIDYRYVGRYVNRHIEVDCRSIFRPTCRPTCRSSIGRYVDRYVGRGRGVHKIHMIPTFYPLPLIFATEHEVSRRQSRCHALIVCTDSTDRFTIPP